MGVSPEEAPEEMRLVLQVTLATHPDVSQWVRQLGPIEPPDHESGDRVREDIFAPELQDGEKKDTGTERGS